jgi:hypothetical protein
MRTYQNFKDTIDRGTTVGTKVVSDVFSARAPVVESLSLTLGEFNGPRRENDIRGKSTASFLLAGLAVTSSLTPPSQLPSTCTTGGEVRQTFKTGSPVTS